MEVTIERIETEQKNIEVLRSWTKQDRYELFNVHVGDERILTLFTECNTVMNKWVSEQQRANRKNKNKKYPLIVGMCVDRDLEYLKKGLNDNPYDIIALCTGSDCLLYRLPSGEYYGRSGYGSNEVPKVLKEFLADSNAIFVGPEMDEVTEKLEKDQKLKVERSVDIHLLSSKVLGIWIRPMDEFNLEQIAYVMLDKSMEVDDRFVIHDKWRDYYGSRRFDINQEYVKKLTMDAFILHDVGTEYIDTTTKLA